MLFENNDINLDNLPKAENITFTPLKPAFKTLLFLNWGVFFLILYIAAFCSVYFFQSEIKIETWWIVVTYSIISLLFIGKIIVIQYGFPKKGYRLRDHDIVYRTGLINRRLTAVPFNRIQHSEIRQSVVARIFGISKIKIFTAGGNTSDLSINGLLPETAQKIKDYLSKTISSYE